MALDSFNVYHSYLQALDPLNDAECGRLFKACLQYSMTGKAPELRGNERFIFPSWKSQIDRDREKHAAKCRRNAENISIRWNTTVYDRTNSYTKHTKGVKEKREGFPPCSPSSSLPDPLISTPYNPPSSEKRENTPPQSPQGAAFDAFWAEYPKKVGKVAAKKAFGRAIRAASLESLLSAVRRQKCGSQWTRDGGQYIPNPATWLNQGRWEDELPEEPGAAALPRRRYETRVIDGREVDVEVADDD